MSRYFKRRLDSRSALLMLITTLIGKELEGKYGGYDKYVLLPKTGRVIKFSPQWITEMS